LTVSTHEGIAGLPGANGLNGQTGGIGPAGETLRDQVERFYAGEFDFPTLAGEGFEAAPPDTDHTSGLTKQVFDDTTPMAVLQKFRLKEDVNTSIETGNDITFKIKGKATAFVTNNVVFKLKYWAVAPGTSLTPSPTTVDLGTFTMASGSGEEEEFSVDLSYSILVGWAINTKIRFVLIRQADDGSDTLVDDFEVTEFAIIIPRI